MEKSEKEVLKAQIVDMSERQLRIALLAMLDGKEFSEAVDIAMSWPR